MREVYLTPLDTHCLWLLSSQRFQVTLPCLCSENVFSLIHRTSQSQVLQHISSLTEKSKYGLLCLYFYLLLFFLAIKLLLGISVIWYVIIISWEIMLVDLYFYFKVVFSWLKAFHQQKYIVSQFWRLEFQDQDFTGLVPISFFIKPVSTIQVFYK